MAIAWEQLAKIKDHPTIDAILEVSLAIKKLLDADRPTNKSAAKRSLEDIAALFTYQDKHGRREPLKGVSLLRKIERFDRQTGLSVLNLFKDWQDPSIDLAVWKKKTEEFEKKKRVLEQLIEKYQEIAEVRPKIISIRTTSFLNIRFWPGPLSRYYRAIRDIEFAREILKDLTKTEHEELGFVELQLETLEPTPLINMAAQDSGFDLIVSYGEKNWIEAELTDVPKERKEAIPLHRCLLAPPGFQLSATHPTKKDVLDVLRHHRLAILREARETMRSFPWDDVEKAAKGIDRREQTVELHAFALGRCGLAFSRLELLSESELKRLDFLELNGPEWGESQLVLIEGRKRDDSAPEIARKLLTFFAREELREIKREYASHKELTKLKYSYLTARAPGMKKYEWRHGDLSILAAPRAIVKGRLTMDQQSYGLFATLKKVGEEDFHLALRGSREGEYQDAFLASLRFERKQPDYVVGLWAGRLLGGDDCDDGGIWIWHSRKDLSNEELKAIVKAYRERNPIDLFPKIV